MVGLELEDYEPQPESRRCDHPKCFGLGEFRAPKSRHDLSHYLWFCLDHVRQFNANWDYFEGMSQAAIELFQRENLTWHRPTWRLGNGLMGRAAMDPVVDDFGLRGWAKPASHRSERIARVRRPRSPPERKALAMLNLGAFASFDDIKARYKELAKRYHPDLNGGSKVAEERLKLINRAYAFLVPRGEPPSKQRCW